MLMSLPFYIASRYLISKKSTNAINIISGVSVLAITIGTAALIVVLSVFNGFDGLVKSLYNSFNPDLKITVVEGKVFVPDENKLQQISALKEVEAISFSLEENVLLKYGNRQTLAVMKGVDENFTKVSAVNSKIVRGNFLLKDKGEIFLVLGAGIEAAMDVNIEDEFSPITIYVPKKENQSVLNPEDAFNKESVIPKGTFAIQEDFDSKYVFVDLDFARKILNYSIEVSALEIRLKPKINEQQAQKAIAEILGKNFSVKNRYEQEEVLYKVMKTEKWIVYLILTFILGIASFNMIGSLTMLVIDKKKDIAVLKTLGADAPLIRKIFLFEGLLMSVGGTLIGFILGIGICLAQQQFKLIALQGMGSFVVDAYPVEMKLVDFLLVLGTVIAIGLVASIFPSGKAAQEKLVFKED